MKIEIRLGELSERGDYGPTKGINVNATFEIYAGGAYIRKLSVIIAPHKVNFDK
jgi:hypothetical protein